MTNQELRLAVLRMTYDAYERGALPLQEEQYIEAFRGEINGDPRPAIINALDILEQSGNIIAQRSEYTVPPYTGYFVKGITPKGVGVFEESGDLRPQGSPATFNFNGPVGSVQQGNHNTAHVVQNVGGDIGKLVEALIALRDATAADDNATIVNTLAAQAIEEASRTQSVTDRLTRLVTGIGTFIQTSGAAIPAYQALYLAAPHVGIHGLPPPPTSP
jgi:hypothetical protein